MIDTLREYIKENQGEELAMTKKRLTELLGDHTTVYYGILMACVSKLLRGSENSTSRCIIMYGASSSGKSTIVKYLGNIFISYGFRQTKGIFDENLTATDANVQLLVLDECNVYNLFRKENLSDTKKLLEG